jgi:hypothetical protein
MHAGSYDDDMGAAAALLNGNLRLLDADQLRAGQLDRLVSRNALECKPGGSTLFLPPDVATYALWAADRRVCFVTHAWHTCVHPDPDGVTLGALLRFLHHPLGKHVVGVFVDFSCLYQWPRTPDQELAFQASLQVLAPAFASPLGTTVARCAVVPPCPAEHASAVAVFAAPDAPRELLQWVLAGPPPSRQVASLAFDKDACVWRAMLGSAE